jgi:hypothetical protein
MAEGNGKRQAQAIPLLVLVPKGAFSPHFQVVGQWHTGTGILCPPQRCPAQPLVPALIVQMFITLVNQGVVHQVIREEGKEPVLAPLPGLEIAFGKLEMQEEAKPAESAEAPAPSAEDLEKKWGEGV